MPRARWDWEMQRPNLYFLLGLIALSAPVFYATNYWKPEGYHAYAIAGNLLLLAFVGLLLWWFRSLKCKPLAWTSGDLGLVRHRKKFHLLLGLAVGALYFGAFLLVFRRVAPSSEHVGIVVLSSVIVAPIVEEITDRGLIFGFLLKKHLPRFFGPTRGLVMAYLASAVVFMWQHEALFKTTDPRQFFVFGLLLNFLFHRTGSLVPCIAAHATDNALVTIFQFVGPFAL